MNATELADYLVRKGHAVPDAHEVVGKIVMRAIEAGNGARAITLAELQSVFGAD